MTGCLDGKTCVRYHYGVPEMQAFAQYLSYKKIHFPMQIFTENVSCSLFYVHALTKWEENDCFFH